MTALVFGIAFVVYVALVPHFLLYASPPTGDQPYYLMDTLSLVQDGDLNVRNNFENRDEDKFYSRAPHPPGFVGMSAPYPLPSLKANAVARPAHEEYNAHLPGLGILLVPAWIVGSWFSLWWPATIVLMCAIGALVGVNVFLLAHDMSGRRWIAWSVWLPLTFAPPLMVYSYLLFTELSTALLLVYAFRRLALGWSENGPLRLALVGGCIAYIPWLAWRCVPLSLVLVAYAAVQCWRHRRGVGEGVGSRPWRIASCLAPVAASAAILGWYNTFLYGSPAPSSKTLLGGSLVTNFHWPWESARDLRLFLVGAFGLFLDRSFGLFVYAPISLLACAGVVALVRRGRPCDRRLVLWLTATTVPYLFMIAAWESWNGSWCPPARYLTTFVPLAAIPLAASLTFGSRRYGVLYILAAAVGFGAMAIMMFDPRLMFPLWEPSVLTWLAESPASPLRVDLRGVLPSFVHPTDGNTFKAAATAAGALLVGLTAYALLARAGGRTAPRLGLPAGTRAPL